MSGFYVTAEVCADSAEDVRVATEGGADRIELCAQLATGGLTPSRELMHAARAATPLPIYAMLRPRAGDFSYTDQEVLALKEAITMLRGEGADGFVFGSVQDRDLNEIHMILVGQETRPFPLVVHRAFDELRDQDSALETLIEFGVDLVIERVLTSGDPRGVEHGLDRLRALVVQAGDRIEVMPGGGVRAHNVAEVVRRTDARAIHFSAKLDYSLPLRVEDVRAVVSALRSV